LCKSDFGSDAGMVCEIQAGAAVSGRDVAFARVEFLGGGAVLPP